MAEQSGRQPFRFRLPWLMSAAAPPTAPRPIAQPQPTTPPTSARPPFRPPGLAPPRPQVPPRTEPQPQSADRTPSRPSSPAKPLPSQSQATLKPKSQPPSPVQTARGSRAASQPSSPSKTAPPQLQEPAVPESQPPSPIPTSQKSRATSQPPSSSRTTISQTLPRTDSQSSPPPTKTPKSQILSQSTSPSHTTTKPEDTTRTSAQSSSPSVPSTQPPSPSRVASQLEAAPQKDSHDHLPLIQTPQSQPTTQASIQAQSPAKSSASPNELASTKVGSRELEISERPQQFPHETENSSSKIYHPELKTVQPSGSSAIDLNQHSEPKSKPDEIKSERMKSKMQEKEEMSTILIEGERQQTMIPELPRRASGSNIQTRSQLHTSENEKDLQKTQAGVHETDTPAKVAAGKERNPVQNERHTITESRPLQPQGDHSVGHKEIRDEISRFAHKMSADHSHKTIDENRVSVMTLAGENTGATMHLGSESPRRESSVHIHRGYKLNQEDISEATTDGENSTKGKFNDPKTKENTASTTYINSNTQSVNNSIMMNSSINERSPGVHMVFTHYPDEPIKSNRNTDSVNAKKADFNITQSQKLTHEPTVRRRCLRGLFLESSDSDPDNPQKPRRHGCRHDCNERKNGIDY